ncbi:4698_t:CDS:1, partial [Dentiscutata erythropus]
NNLNIMLEEDALSTSFFEPSQFQSSISASPEIPEVSQSASFTTDSLNNINPWDPPQLDFSTTRILGVVFFFY